MPSNDFETAYRTGTLLTRHHNPSQSRFSGTLYRRDLYATPEMAKKLETAIAEGMNQ